MPTVALVFAPLAPLVVLAGTIVFWIGSWVYKHQLMFVFMTKVDGSGTWWLTGANSRSFLGSTIAKERRKDDNSKIWATYQKVSTEYDDDDFLGRANDDIDIILTFAALFSAVNSTFIVEMVAQELFS
ncbi:hypothetical protein EV702DRAFT_1201581 [Suillus placidus]|uniref:Uncharacterized protein n=1 Tax=Suillus placidus TaxID=48579 RepID=A0A9P6ZMB8_9AGAM|nr:hypothetical protein EV702DRAFT_1201581 [Suillus placidus]